ALGRLVPGFRIVLTVAAGALRMGRTNFLVGAAAASILWAAIYYWLGYALGAGVTQMIRTAAGRAYHNPEVAAAVVVVVVLAVVAIVGTVVWKRRATSAERAP
ncbi:MAG: DedA family protein, partial [Gemmatimonadaceae bacterium]